MLQWLKLMPQSKSKVLLLNARLVQRGKDSNINALILIGITVAAVIVIAIVVVMMGEFCRGLLLPPLSQDLFSARVYRPLQFFALVTKTLSTAAIPITQISALTTAAAITAMVGVVINPSVLTRASSDL